MVDNMDERSDNILPSIIPPQRKITLGHPKGSKNKKPKRNQVHCDTEKAFENAFGSVTVPSSSSAPNPSTLSLVEQAQPQSVAVVGEGPTVPAMLSTLALPSCGAASRNDSDNDFLLPVAILIMMLLMMKEIVWLMMKILVLDVQICILLTIYLTLEGMAKK